MTTPPLDITIRDMDPGDESFVMSSWKKSNRDSSELPNPLYYSLMQHRIASILADAETRLIVATTDDARDFILGWACATRGILHYAYTRQAFRGARVARRLVEALGIEAPISVTHWTQSADNISRDHRGALNYEPERLRE